MQEFHPIGFSHTIFKERYAFTEDETWSEMCRRVARQAATAETPEKVQKYEDKFYDILVSNAFIPGGRILYNSGRPKPQLLNCFIMKHDLDSKEGWATIAHDIILTSMCSGGCGIDFSDIRPRGAEIAGHKGVAPGPVELMKLINNCGEPIRAGGARRVALMFSLDLTHPSIEEFLNVKLKESELKLANISIRSKDTTAFIKAIHEDLDWELAWKGKYKSIIKARKLWNIICENAWKSAEPGFLNWELVAEENTIYYCSQLVTSNPCITGDTLIATADGRNAVSIKQLTEEGKDVLVYSTHLCTGKVEIKWGRNPKVTGKGKEIWKLTLDDGSYLTATPDHKILTKELKYIELSKLKPGQSLFPFNSFDNDGYRQVCNIEVPFKKWKDLQTTVDLHNHKVVSVEFCGYEDVYNITVDDNHNYHVITNAKDDKYINSSGICIKNCGEVVGESASSCDLGHLVLTRFVTNDAVNWEYMGETIRTAVRFLDNILDVNQFPLPEMRRIAEAHRRIGLGTTGLADMLVLLGYRYGSDEGNKFIDKLYRFISKNAYEASIMLAIEKGAFPACKPELHIKSGFVKRMPPKIKNLIKEHGIRNCSILAIAPTGTVSIVSGNCSSGIEPMMAPGYERSYFDENERKTELIIHPLFKQFLDEGKDVSHFVGCRELSVRDHMEIQKIVQRHIDNSISKTINMPEHYSIEDMATVWLEYMPYLKGTTFYRENSRFFYDKDGNKLPPPISKFYTAQEAIALYKAGMKSSDEVEAQQCKNGSCDL